MWFENLKVNSQPSHLSCANEWLMNLTSSEGENYETKCSDLFALTNYNDAGTRKSWGRGPRHIANEIAYKFNTNVK